MIGSIALLGATGSIGRQTVDVIRQVLPGTRISLLAANTDIEQLVRFANEFRSDALWVPGAQKTWAKKHLHAGCKVYTGVRGISEAVANTDAQVVVNALSSLAGLAPTIAAIEAGKDIALANKESLVSGGEIIMPLAKKHGVQIRPIDSEHSAILQCVQGCAADEIEKIILTASGGPFRLWSRRKMAAATAADALKHPRWQMGPKITVDSATLMNKGFEIIEAVWLFGLDLSRIEVVVHPQSIVHSMVQFRDGQVLAQMGPPDMRMSILYALCGPARPRSTFERLDFAKIGKLTFHPPDEAKFPALALAKQALRTGGSHPAILNCANDFAVQKFLAGDIGFADIAKISAEALAYCSPTPLRCTDDIFAAQRECYDFLTSTKEILCKH